LSAKILMAHSNTDAAILAQLLSEPANSHLSIVADAGDSNSLSSGFGVTDQGVPDELNGGGSSRLLFLPSSSDGKNTQTTHAASSAFGSTELPWWSVSQCDKSSSFEDFVTVA